MPLQFTLAWRYLYGRKLRTFLTTLAVVFGVLVIFGMNIILPTLLAAFQANLMAAGGTADVTITNRSGSGFPQEVVRKLDGIAGIRAVSASLERTVNLPADFVDADPARPDRVTALDLIGLDPVAARALQVYLVQPPGRFLQPDDRNATVISQSLADAYGIKLGDSIKVPSVTGVVRLSVVGILPPRALPGNEAVLVTLAQAQGMAGQADQVNTIAVALTSSNESLRNKTIASIKAVLGNDYQLDALRSDSSMFASLTLGQAAFNMFGLLALFMGGFIIFNTFRTVVAERRRDIGMLRALGARRSTITGMILVESLLQGLIGSGIGLLLGYLFGAGLLRVAGPMLGQYINLKTGQPVITLSIVLTSSLLGVGVTVLSALIPAFTASRITPMDALRTSASEEEYNRRARAGLIAGLIMLGLALLAAASGNLGLISLGGLFFLLGLILAAPALLRPIAFVLGRLTALAYARQGTGDLAQGNLTRQPARVTITASATMIGLAIVVAMGGMTTSLNGMMVRTLHESLASDYLFVPPSIAVWNSDVGSGPDFASRLQAIQGVGDVSTLRFSSSSVKGSPISLLGIDPAIFPKVSGLDFTQGDSSAYAALAHGRNMIVNGAFLATLPVSLGERVALATPTGPQEYRIVAIGSDILNAKVVTAYISQANLAADFGRSEDVFLQLNLKPGVQKAAVDSHIRAVAADYPQFTIIAGKDYIGQMMQLVNVVFVGMYFLLAFLAFPSLIAMLNTLTINVLERRREIGMLRAVGGTRSQIRRMVLAEALLLASVGTAFGLLSGLYLGYVVVRALGTLFPMQYAFPLAGVLAAVAIGLLFGALAAVIPANQAARLQVVQALRYE